MKDSIKYIKIIKNWKLN